MQDTQHVKKHKSPFNITRKKTHEYLDDLLGPRAMKVRRLYTQFDVCMHPSASAPRSSSPSNRTTSSQAQALAKANKEHASLLAANSPNTNTNTNNSTGSGSGSGSNEISGVLWIIQESVGGMIYLVWTPYSVIEALNEELYINSNIHRRSSENSNNSSMNNTPTHSNSNSNSNSASDLQSIIGSFSPFRKRQSSKTESPTNAELQAAEKEVPAIIEDEEAQQEATAASQASGYVSAVVSPSNAAAATTTTPTPATTSTKFPQSQPNITAAAVLKANPSHLYTFAIDLRDVLSIQRHIPRMGWAHITVTLRDGVTHGPLYFHDGGINNFFECLKKIAALSSLESASGSTAGAGSGDTFRVSALAGATATEKMSLVEPLEHSLSTMQFDEYLGDVYKGNRSLSWQIFEWGSKVTRSLRDTKDSILSTLSATSSPTSSQENHQQVPTTALPGQQSEQTVEQQQQQQQQHQHLDSDVAVSSTSLEQEQSKHQQQQVLRNGLPRRLPQPSAASSEHSDDFEMITEQDQDTGPDDFPYDGIMARESPLTKEKWESYFSQEDGKLLDEKALRRDVFYGGVSEEIRKEVWMFLLGFYPMNSTRDERAAIHEEKTREYEQYKLQWTSITEQQEARFKKFRDRKARIEKDVVRTDRNIELYKAITADDPSDESNAYPNANNSNSNSSKKGSNTAGSTNNLIEVIRGHQMLHRMYDILLTYTFYNFDIGYCQGMNDILSPILAVIQSEAESFWCFAHLMVVMQRNFQRDQNGMTIQLQQLLELVKVMLPNLYEYFESHECLNMFFCFRWLLVQFKRELTEFSDVQRLWEVLWSEYYTRDFHLFVALSLLSQHADAIIAGQLEFDALLKYINELSGKINVDKTLETADKLFHEYQSKARRGIITVLDEPHQQL